MNKVIGSVLVAGLLATGAYAKGNPFVGPAGPQGPQGEQGIQGPVGPAGADGTNGSRGSRGTSGTNGTNGATGATGPQGVAGTNGTNGTNGEDGLSYCYKEDSKFDQQRAATTATDSVELNPDHEGWSVGAGFSPTRGEFAGAVGIMYSEIVGGYDDTLRTIGYNVKAYQAEGGYNGVGVGITLGF